VLNVTAVLSFVLATTFSPGPNNISSASIGVLHGYKKTLKYMTGIVTGFFLVMLLCSWISMTLLDAYPALETVLRFLGAGYILWLAYHTLRANYTFSEDNRQLLGFTNGLVLQILNPKAIIYGLTLYSTLLAPATKNTAYQVLSALLLAVVGFCSVSTWALFGSLIRAQLKQPKTRQTVNLILALVLVYTAVELTGLL